MRMGAHRHCSSLFFGLLCFTIVAAANTCLWSCSPGDTLSGISCFDDYQSTGAPYCPSGWTEIGTPLSKCRKDLCDYTANGQALHSGGIIGTYGSQSGSTITVCTVGGNPDGCKCYFGYYARAPPGGCAYNDDGSGLMDLGHYTRLADGSSPRCYYHRDDMSCSGKFIDSGGTCEKDAPSTTFGNCDNGGTLLSNGVTCRRTYPAVSLVGATRCGSSYAPSSTGCSWCGGITVCLPTGSTCYADCYAATASQTTCTRLGSSCRWCGTSGSIGVCQPQSVACFSTCLAATADPSACGASSACKWCDTTSSIGVCQPKAGACYSTCLQSSVEADVCDASLQCKWCDTATSIGVCQSEAGTCYATCLDASITAEAAVCGGSLLCEWCSGPAYLPYCRRNDEACLSRCVDVAPYNIGICQVPSVVGTCRWCGGLEYCVDAGDAAPLRCASRCETMIWRQDVCDGALACHWCPQHGGRCKPVKGRTQGYVSWRGEFECDTGSATESNTAVDSKSLSARMSLSVSESVSVTWSMSPTAVSCSTDVTQTATLVVVPSYTAATSVSDSLSSSQSANLTTSPSASRSISPSMTGRSSSASPSALDTLSPSLSATHSEGSRSRSSVSLTQSFQLPPCNATHAAILRRVWPALFNFTTSYSAVKVAGFPGIEVTGDVNPALIYLVPHLLRVEVLAGARPALVTPVPYEPPNERGFVHRGGTAIALSWVNRSTLRVAMGKIADYWIDTSEDITIDVPFEEIVLCNRTARGSVALEPTLRLVAVRVVGPAVNDVVAPAVQALATVFTVASVLSGDASSAAAVQTLAVIGMTPCGQPAGKNTLANERVLGPLPVGVDGFAGVLIGNAVLVGGFGLAQLVAARVVMRLRRLVFANACAVVRAPSLTLAGLFALYQGTFFAASQLAVRPDSSAAERGWGSVVFAVCAVLPPALAWYCWRVVVRQCVLYRYERSPQFRAMYAGSLQRALLPLGRIEPPHVRQRYASLISSYVLNRPELPVLGVLVPYLVTWLTLWQPMDAVECSWFLSIALCIHAAVAAWVLHWRPHRFLYGSPLFAVGVLLNGVLLLFCVVSLTEPETLSRDLVTLIAVLQLVLQLMRMLLQLSGLRLEETLGDVPTEVSWTSGVLSNNTTAAALSELEELLLVNDEDTPLPDDGRFEQLLEQSMALEKERDIFYGGRSALTTVPKEERQCGDVPALLEATADSTDSEDSGTIFQRTTNTLMSAVNSLLHKLGLHDESLASDASSEDVELTAVLQPTDAARELVGGGTVVSDPKDDLALALQGLEVLDERKALHANLRIEI